MIVCRFSLVLLLIVSLALPGLGSEGVTPESTMISLADKIVTAVFGDSFYVQEPNRTTGIRVAKPGHGVVVGDKVNLLGSLKTDGAGEKYVAADALQVTAQGSVPRPLGMTNMSMGGWSWRPEEIAPDVWVLVWKPYFVISVYGAIVPFPCGLLMRTWGTVTYIAPDASCLYIDDGSHLQDYAKTHVGAKVFNDVDLDFSAYRVGDFLCVTGACSCYADPTTGDPLACLRGVRPSGIQLVSETR